MKKLITTVAVIATLGLATSAHAVTRWSYNPSSFSPIKVLAQWYQGWHTRSVVYSYDPCLVVTVNEYAFGVLVNSTVTRFECGK